MVRKALMVAGVVFVLYTIFISQIKPHWSIVQHYWQLNEIKAEGYLYNTQQVHTVIVGSSLSSRLMLNQPGVYNLSLGGLSALDGLAIVTKHPSSLRTVLVEINIIDREADNNFIADLTNPMLVPAKRTLPSLRSDKQPLAVLSQQLEMRLEPIFHQPASPEPLIIDTKETLYDKLWQERANDYAIAPTTALLKQQLDRLKRETTSLKRQGIQVVFYETPVDRRLCNYPKARAIRLAFKRYFPPANYHYVATADCAAYQTRDGVHLTLESAIKYTQFLQKQLKEINK
jgi:hypothetical protein